jgi:hypothetical protein
MNATGELTLSLAGGHQRFCTGKTTLSRHIACECFSLALWLVCHW